MSDLNAKGKTTIESQIKMFSHFLMFGDFYKNTFSVFPVQKIFIIIIIYLISIYIFFIFIWTKVTPL